MIKEKFEKLKVPTDKSFITEKIFDTNHRVGKNSKNQPCLLFKTQETDKRITSYNGENLTIDYNKNCTLHEKNKKISESFSILSCISEEKNIRDIFFDICESTFVNISKKPTILELKDLVQSIIDLFKKMSVVKSGQIGLWGELFLIESSKNKSACLQAWHNHPEQKYDFYNDNEALEVKCTTQTDRKHIFRHDQLISKLSDHYVVSVMLQENSSSGKSVVDLFNNILKSNIEKNLITKLKENYYKVIGKTNKDYLHEFKYDYDYAKKNLLYFKVSELSKIENTNPAISNISYTVDLSQNQNVDHLSKDKFTSYLYFPSA
jgi:hypothetical protein